MILLLFSTNEMLFSRAIRAFTRSQWSHVDIVCLDDQKVIGALALQGVKEYSIANRLAYSTKYEFRVLEGSQQGAEDYAHSQIGKGYDYAGVAGIVFGTRRWEDDDKWFCSELVAKAALVSGNRPLHFKRKKLARITPQCLYEMTEKSDYAFQP